MKWNSERLAAAAKAAKAAAAAKGGEEAPQLPVTDRERGREHMSDRLNEAEERRETHTYSVGCLH